LNFKLQAFLEPNFADCFRTYSKESSNSNSPDYVDLMISHSGRGHSWGNGPGGTAALLEGATLLNCHQGTRREKE